MSREGGWRVFLQRLFIQTGVLSAAQTPVILAALPASQQAQRCVALRCGVRLHYKQPPHPRVKAVWNFAVFLSS